MALLRTSTMLQAAGRARPSPRFGLWWRPASLLLALALVASACGASEPVTLSGGSAGSGGAAPKGGLEELTVVNFGGTFAANWKKDIIDPFEKQFNARVTEVTSLTMDTVAKMRAQKGNPQMDVVMFGELGGIVASDEGLLDPLDDSHIPNMKQAVEQARVAGNGYVNNFFVAMVLAYNTDKIKTPPTSWNDLWDPAYKGHVALSDTNSCCGFAFVLLQAKLNGGSADNIDPGFKKVASLKPNVLAFYTSHDQMAQLLNQGEAWIGPWTNDRAASQHAQKAPIDMVFPKDGAVVFANSMGIPKGSKHKDLAEKYINFALDPAQQKAFAQDAFVAPVVKGVQLPPEVLKYVPYSEDVTSKMITLDWRAIAKNTSAWQERWQREITSK